MRTTLNNVEQTKTSIKETHENITIARTRLRQEDDLKNARELTMSFEKRIGDLRTDNERDSRQTPEERAKAILQEQRQKSRHYLAEMRKLIEALNNFVKEHLAAMVAAEDLGGPVVGDLIDVDSETLKAGFTRQGRPKKPTGESDKSKAERKRRNDEIWGPGDSDVEYGSRGEKEAAGADFRALTEDLLNAAAGDENSTTYIKIRRESAAVRFLVRAKVAQFHPDDARRLRLVDFGQELDD